jgi:membrane protease YdiL (CAAX protease family)
MVVVMIASNLFFLYLTTLVDGIQLAVRPLEISYVLGYFAFKGIRIFVEESVFRGFLLVPGISGSNRVFWIANLSQALVFAVVHLLIPNAPLHHYALGMFAFVSSLVYGLLNRRAGSLLPSWIIHLTNGVLGSLVFA